MSSGVFAFTIPQMATLVKSTAQGILGLRSYNAIQATVQLQIQNSKTREREGGKKENINKQRQESTDRNNRLSPHSERLQQRLTLNRMQSIGAESITDENRCKLLTPAQTTFENFGGSYSELPHTSQIYDADPFLLSAGALPWTNPKHPHLLSTGHKKATP